MITSKKNIIPDFYSQDLASLANSEKFYVTIINGVFNFNLSKLPRVVSVSALNGLNNTQLVFNGWEKSFNALYINYVNSAKNNEGDTSFILKEGVKIRVVEKFFFSEDLKKNQKSIIDSSWIIGEGAELKHYGLGRTENDSNLETVHNVCVRQKKNSTCSFLTFYLGTVSTQNNLQIILEEPGAKSELFSISLLGNTDFVENNIVVKHLAPGCQSSQVYKGVFNGESRGLFNSTVLVAKGAQKSITTQQNNNILISDYCSVNSNPQLEIFADDVKCEHGSTIGQIDEKALFYLCSRGLSKEAAVGILLKAFLNDVLKEVQNSEIESFIFPRLNRELGRFRELNKPKL